MRYMPQEPTPNEDGADLVITHVETNNEGRYEARLGDVANAGELTYSRTNADTIVADHTQVNKTLRGRGIANRLVERLVADARAGGYRIVPVCPYIKALFGRHPEWSDVMHENSNP